MDQPLARRVRMALPAMIVGVALLVGVLLLPDLTPGEAIPVVGQESLHGRVTESLGTDTTGLPLFVVEVLDGPLVGERIEAVVQDGSAAMPGSGDRRPYGVGDEVVVTRFTGPAGGFAVITEPWRVPLLGLMAAVFALFVLLVGGLRGARSLIALAFTLAVVMKVVVPLLLRGVDPILLAVGAGSAVTVATLLLTEGRSLVTLAATLGTFAALALTAVLAGAFSAAAEFTALQGSEEIAFLIPLVGDRIDLSGILLAATVFGALGVLDDVTVTQAATVEQIHRADRRAPRGRVVNGAMRVGRSHIAATVNTLMLAYLGAGLPLLLLFALGGQDPLAVLNSEVVAVEVIRALVGSIGIVAAVPLTTFVAAVLMVRHQPTAAAPA
ncbi:MAG TPA: YibE/F family protein [Candidatus Limnocylindrales bacterium]|nr:YibE/F family protein [Candidatus Limnocylindrales bacterium]